MKLPISTAFIKSLKNYSFSFFVADLKAAFVVSLIALPLSMALSIAIGLPPQHGLYTAIVAGIITPLFGGSKFQVSGPTAAFIVILAPIVSEFGLRGIIWCQIMAGIFLLIMGFSRMGKLVNYIPYPVTTGFTAGIAIVILTLSLKDFMGLDIPSMPDDFIQKLITLCAYINTFKLPEFLISIITLTLILYGGKITKLVPTPIIAIGAATFIAYMLQMKGIADIITIGDKFSYTDLLGNAIKGIPPYPPVFHIPGFSADKLFALPSLEEFKKLLSPSLIVAALAALESLLSATVADSLTGKKHDPNAELTGIGLANIFCGMASGIPATGAIARTATNINAGAKSPISCAVHALLILLYMVSLSKYVSLIPMASLAALLFITAYRMSHIRQVISVLKNAPKHDKIVLLACMLATCFIDMVVGVTVGILLASILFMKRVADLSEIELQSSDTTSGRLMSKIPDDVMLIRIQGVFFFGNAEKMFDRTTVVKSNIRNIILDLTNIQLMDMTGIVALRSIIDKAIGNKMSVSICSNKTIEEKLIRNLGEKYSNKIVYFPSLDDALAQW